MKTFRLFTVGSVLLYTAFGAIAAPEPDAATPSDTTERVGQIMQRVRDFPFNPVEGGRSKEPVLDQDGVADLANEAWRIRLLAIRDLARLGGTATPALLDSLEDGNSHVRHVAAFALGLWKADGAEDALIALLGGDEDPVVRSQAVISLAQIKCLKALPVLEQHAQNDPSRDVKHQCDLAIHRIKNYQGPEIDLADAYAGLDETKFEQVRVGKQAPDFALTDVDGKSWKLSDFRGKKDVVLIWIFADWCPVCHNEFRELIELKEEYQAQGIEVVTIECHDPYRARVMAGQEFQPEYWFSKESPQGFYEGKIWWRHLVDPAGAIGATYGVQPLEFVVHAEWINRPGTVIVDKDGTVRFAYYGTFWGDRPSVEQTLEMLRTGQFEFAHPKRLKVPSTLPIPR